MNELTNMFEGKAVRTVLKNDGVWFVAKDVATCLGFTDAKHATRMLDEDECELHNVESTSDICELHNVRVTSRARKTQDMTLINESGIYHLCFVSRKEECKRFRKWVTKEVLPSIRKNGYYLTDELKHKDLVITRKGSIIELKDKEIKLLKEHIERQDRSIEILDSLNSKLLGLPRGLK